MSTGRKESYAISGSQQHIKAVKKNEFRKQGNASSAWCPLEKSDSSVAIDRILTMYVFSPKIDLWHRMLAMGRGSCLYNGQPHPNLR